MTHLDEDSDDESKSFLYDKEVYNPESSESSTTAGTGPTSSAAATGRLEAALGTRHPEYVPQIANQAQGMARPPTLWPNGICGGCIPIRLQLVHWNGCFMLERRRWYFRFLKDKLLKNL
jgi:hypothetical protein